MRRRTVAGGTWVPAFDAYKDGLPEAEFVYCDALPTIRVELLPVSAADPVVTAPGLLRAATHQRMVEAYDHLIENRRIA
jgi:hypothetical protein